MLKHQTSLTYGYVLAFFVFQMQYSGCKWFKKIVYIFHVSHESNDLRKCILEIFTNPLLILIKSICTGNLLYLFCLAIWLSSFLLYLEVDWGDHMFVQVSNLHQTNLHNVDIWTSIFTKKWCEAAPCCIWLHNFLIYIRGILKHVLYVKEYLFHVHFLWGQES